MWICRKGIDDYKDRVTSLIVAVRIDPNTLKHILENVVLYHYEYRTLTGVLVVISGGLFMNERNTLEETIIKKFKKSHAFKGASPSDISNSVIRNILPQISEMLYGKFKEEFIIETLDYFDWKCPYTGRPIDEHLEDFEIDHIIPQNKKDCGLNIRGNLVCSDKRANSMKNGLRADDFLLIQNVKETKRKKLEKFWEGTSIEERLERLDKIRKWQKECGYDPKTIKRKVQKIIEQMYKDVTNEQKRRIEQVVQQFEDVPVIVFNPADVDKFREKLLEKKHAKIVLYDKEGRIVNAMDWDASKFSDSSDLRHNITTKTFWKKREKGDFIRVEVTVQN